MQKLRFFFTLLDGRNADSALLREICRPSRVVGLLFSRMRALIGRLCCWLNWHSDEISTERDLTLRSGEFVGSQMIVRCAKCRDGIAFNHFGSYADRVRWEREQ